MLYNPDGRWAMDRSSTDRPHTAKAYAFYRLKWKHMETDLGSPRPRPGHSDQ